MVVYRDEAVAKEDDMYDQIDLELVKKSGKGLGLSIVGRKNGSGVFISDVVPGGIAELHGGLMKGDMIITVDGKDLKNATQVYIHILSSFVKRKKDEINHFC
jgi:multiple PDZ domain protein